MNCKSLFLLLFALTFMLPRAYSQSNDPSTEEIIEALRSEEEVTPLSQFFINDKVCLPHRQLTDSIKDTCEATIAADPACQGLDEEQRMDCQQEPSYSLDFWHFVTGCGGGVFQSAKAFLGFIWDRVKWLWRNTTSQQVRSESYEQASEYMEGINLYLNTEYEKAYNEVSLPFKKTKALARMSMAISKQILNSVTEMISQQFEGIRCMNVQARSQLICQFLGEIFVPPVSGLALLKFGMKATKTFPNLTRAFDQLENISPRGRRANNRTRLNEAESLLGKNLSREDRDAIIQAHEVGRGETGKDGTPARIGNYTTAQLRQKARILKEQGFNQNEIRLLMENGIVGLSEVESRGFLGIIGDVFRRDPPPPAPPADVARINLPARVALGRARPRAPPSSRGLREVTWKGQSYEVEPPPVRPRRPVDLHEGSHVTVPRSDGSFTTGRIKETLPDGHLNIVFEDVDGWKQKPVHSDRLLGPLSSDIDHIEVGSDVSISRSNGTRSNGEIALIEDDFALVAWNTGNRETGTKWVPMESLRQPIPENNGFALAFQRGLAPRSSIGRVQGADDIKIGKFFQEKNGRIFTIAKVTVDGQSSHRVFYRSNSQTMFRLLPAIRGDGWYDKGIGEDSLTLPPEVQAALSQRARSLNRNQIEQLEPKELDGIIPVGDGYIDYLRSNDHVAHTVSQSAILREGEPKSLKDFYGRYFRKPENVHIEHRSNQPNYETYTNTYQLDSPVYGDVTAYVYSSNNGRLEYTLLKDESGKVWFGDIGNRQTNLSSHGLRRDAIDTENELTMPLWEYEDGIPRGYGQRNERSRGRKGEYSSSWNYIRRMPEIQRWYRENNLPIPE